SPDHAHDSHADHSHGAVHESPWVMLAPLVVLAILSIVGGYVGIGNRFEHFLDPVMAAAHAGARTGAPEEAGSMHLVLTPCSVAAAAFGFFLAWLPYYKRRDLPDKIAASIAGLYTTVSTKYYVDEIYGAVIIRPVVWISTHLLWRTLDQGLIDASVNELAAL